MFLGNDLTEAFWSYWVLGYGVCFVVSLLYIWMDFAQEQDPIPLGMLLRNPYFLLYWLLQLIGSTLAFYLLLSYPPIKSWPSPFIAMIAVFSSSLVLQNQLIKIGDKPILDISGLQKGLRLQVKAEAVKRAAKIEKARVIRKAEALAERFKDKEKELEEIFVQVMLFGAARDAQIDAEQIREQIEAIRSRCASLKLPVEKEFARIIVQTDIDYATRILNRLDA